MICVLQLTVTDVTDAPKKLNQCWDHCCSSWTPQLSLLSVICDDVLPQQQHTMPPVATVIRSYHLTERHLVYCALAIRMI